MRLLLWCVNGRRYFSCRFSLKIVEMNGLSMGGFLFGMVIWSDHFALLKHGILGKMVSADVVVEVVVVEAMDMVQAGFFVIFRRGCSRGMMDVRMAIEVVVGAVVLVVPVVLA